MDQFKSKHQKRVEEMMFKAGQELHSKPTLPRFKTMRLRASLILEEALETIEALGFGIYVKNYSTHSALEFKDITLKPITDKDNDEMSTLERIADGCADIIVVTTGCLSACGVADLPILEEVDKNNLKKFGPGGHIRPDGKWIKPLGHKPPNIRKILEYF